MNHISASASFIDQCRERGVDPYTFVGSTVSDLIARGFQLSGEPTDILLNIPGTTALEFRSRQLLDMTAELKRIAKDVNEKIARAKTDEDVTNIHKETIGRKGSLMRLLLKLVGLSSKERQEFGEQLNEVAATIGFAVDEAEKRISGQSTATSTPIRG